MTPGEGVEEYGAIVEDVEDTDPNPAVVINTPPVPLDEWTAYQNEDGEEVTVAETNPDYNAEAEVVVVAFQDDLDKVNPSYAGEEPLTLSELDCRYYAFPPARLRRVDHVGEEGDDTPEARTNAESVEPEDTHPELTSLAEALGDGATVVVDGEEEPHVEVDKLGETHLIFADGTVRGDVMGPKLAKFASEHLEGDQ